MRHILKIRAARKMMRFGVKRRRRIRGRAISTRTGLPGAKYVRSSVKSVLTFGLTCDIIQSMKGLALEYVSKIPKYAISGGAAPFLRHKARLSAAKPSDFFLELTKNPLEFADCPA